MKIRYRDSRSGLRLFRKLREWQQEQEQGEAVVDAVRMNQKEYQKENRKRRTKRNVKRRAGEDKGVGTGEGKALSLSLTEQFYLCLRLPPPSFTQGGTPAPPPAATASGSIEAGQGHFKIFVSGVNHHYLYDSSQGYTPINLRWKSVGIPKPGGH